MTKPTLQAIAPNIPTAPAPDPFDFASLRLNPSFIETAGVKKLVDDGAGAAAESARLRPRSPSARNIAKTSP